MSGKDSNYAEALLQSYRDAEAAAAVDPKDWTPIRLMRNEAGEYKYGRPGGPGMEGFSHPTSEFPAIDAYLRERRV